MSEFGDRLLEMLAAKGISGNELARKMDTSSSRISQLTTGKNKPDFTFLQALARQFPDVNLRYMLTGEGSLVGKYVPLVEKQNQAAEPSADYRKDVKLSDLAELPSQMARLAEILERLEKKL